MDTGSSGAELAGARVSPLAAAAAAPPPRARRHLKQTVVRVVAHYLPPGFNRAAPSLDPRRLLAACLLRPGDRVAHVAAPQGTAAREGDAAAVGDGGGMADTAEVVTGSAEACGSGAVLAPTLRLSRSASVGAAKQELLQLLGWEVTRTRLRLFDGHGGRELPDDTEVGAALEEGFVVAVLKCKTLPEVPVASTDLVNIRNLLRDAVGGRLRKRRRAARKALAQALNSLVPPSADAETTFALELPYYFTFGPAEAAVLAEALQDNTTLSTLRTCGHINSTGAEKLGRALRCNQTLRVLRLYHSAIGDAGAAALDETLLRHNTALTTLDLTGNDIGAVGAAALAAALGDNHTLVSLELQDNRVAHDGAVALAHALRGNRTLTFLGLKHNLIDPGGARALAAALCLNKTLAALVLASNDIGRNAAVALGDALRRNVEWSGLQSLDLTATNIEAAGAASLCSALLQGGASATTALRSLSLGTNAIGDSGAAAVAALLRCSATPLRSVHLSFNDIGPTGAVTLAEALRDNTTLECMDLYHNVCGPEGAAALGAALQRNTVLKSLTVSHNAIGEEGGAAMCELLRHNATLRQLDLSGNGVDTPAWTRRFNEIARAREGFLMTL